MLSCVSRTALHRQRAKLYADLTAGADRNTPKHIASGVGPRAADRPAAQPDRMSPELPSAGVLPQRTDLGERLGIRLRTRVLLCALLAADPGERLAQVGFDTAGVAKGLVEYRFHAASCIGMTRCNRPRE
jgi:hypothetical protein